MQKNKKWQQWKTDQATRGTESFWDCMGNNQGGPRDDDEPITATGVAEISRKLAKKAGQKWDACNSLLQVNISACRSIQGW